LKYGWEPYLIPGGARRKSPRSDKRIRRYEAVAFGRKYAGRDWDGWKQDFTLGSEPVQSNDAVRLSYANEFYPKRDGTIG